MERPIFVQHVLSAVAHLDDTARLGDHPLASFMFPGRRPAQRAAELRALLRRAIADLQPTDVTETNLGLLRRYAYLERRYLKGLRAAHVAQDLGLGDRQARRVHQEAIEALATAVWSRHERAAESSRVTAANDGELAPASELEAEVSRLGATRAADGTSLGDALRSAVVTVAPLAARHDVRVILSPLPALPSVAIDRAVLRQVLVNLLVTSIENGVHQIDLAAQPNRGAVDVRFTTHFADRAVETLVDSHQHDGLIQVVRRLVQLQGGSVDVRAIDRATSLVTLCLPIIQPVTVLLVDDNPDTRRLFRRYLSGGNYRSIEAGDGRQALDLARDTQPGAIILDVMLPSQDGWETLQALRNDLATERIPVIICSVLNQEELAEALGATAYVTKPVSRDALLTALSQVLSSAVSSPTRCERVR